MNYAVILSGGVGTRMRSDGFPKQYIEIGGKPILVHTLEKFQNSEIIDHIVIVAADTWKHQILQWAEDFGINKLLTIAPGGDSRQESILNGLKVCLENSADENDNVIIHDSVRPLLSNKLICDCFESLDEYDGCMPVISVNDTVYQSQDGKHISSLLNRDTLFAGQAPEAFKLKKYYEINCGLGKEQLAAVRGTSEIAYKNNFNICLIPGEDMNFKLTTPADLTRFKTIIGD